jgi:penicillin-binding protein 1A
MQTVATFWTGIIWRICRRLALAIVTVGVVGALALSCAMLWALHGIVLHRPAVTPQGPTLLLEAADGRPLGRVGPLRLANVPLKAFPPVLIDAVLSIEDRRFYHHFGVDPLGILRAAHANRIAGEIVEGGSTITQQLVKIEYLNDDRTYTRKLREALLAIWLELRLSKDEILDRYLNRVYLGEGAYGMAAAAQLYFGKPATALTLPEAAMLAGLIEAPSRLDPVHHRAAAQARAATVLDAMVANHVVDRRTADRAKAQPATIGPSGRLAEAHSWFTDWIAKRAAALAGSQAGVMRVRTTLRPELQRLAQAVLDHALATQGRRLHATEGALVAMRPDGAVLAMVGGRDYRASQFNRAVDARRQPGSAFKLFVYLAALRQGYAPQDTIDAGPIDIKGWRPQNFDDEHYGRITLAEAFAQSVNTAAVRLAMTVGLDRVIAAARDLGIDEKLPRVPSLALGAAGISLLDLTDAFASVRADRMHEHPWGVAAIGPGDGSRLRATVPLRAAAQNLDPYRQPLIDLLQDVVEHGTGRAAALDGFAAGKTGTSQDYRDAWFIGFNDPLVVGVWVGNDDDSPMRRVVGGTLPAAIWKEFMIRAAPLVSEQTSVAAVAPVSADQPAPMTEPAEGSTAPPAARLCDEMACAGRYHSFRASDCTYQPYGGGPRRICEIGALPSGAVAGTGGTAGDGTNSVAAAALAECDFDACARTYSSFNPADCTYQPDDGGPRQRCAQ